jgi:hypothetical protein
MITRDVVSYDESQGSDLARAAQIADQVAQASTLSDYQRGKELKTLKRQRGNLAPFERSWPRLEHLPSDWLKIWPWTEISPGLVKAFVN